MDHQIKHFFPLCLLFVIPQNIQTRLISLVYHLIISCDFSCTAAQHSRRELTWKVLQSSGSICRVFRLLSTALVSFASRHCSVYFLKPWTRYNSRHCSVLFRLLHRHWPALFRDLLRYLFSCLSVVILMISFASVQPHLKNVRSSSAISFVDYKLK